MQHLLFGQADLSRIEMETDLGLHPLHICLINYRGIHKQHNKREGKESIIPTAMELSEAGVRFKKSKSQCLRDVYFENGVLSIPFISLDDTTEKKFRNLTVFEQLYSGAGRDVTNYLFFMDHMIDSERNVALLRSKGIIRNIYGSDKEVAALFNKLTKGTIPNTTFELQKVKKKR